MHRAIVIVAFALAAAAAHAEGIVDVLARSQDARLARMEAVDPTEPRAVTVRASFARVMRTLGIAHPVALVVVDGDTVAETLQGRTIVANESLADLTEGERVFMLAHELGHIELRHWEQTENLYRKWVPGAVTPAETAPVAALLGREASGLAHAHELEADTYALRALHLMRLPPHDAVSACVHLGITADSATHPGTRKRLASLRAAEAEWASFGQATTRNDPIVSVSRPD